MNNYWNSSEHLYASTSFASDGVREPLSDVSDMQDISNENVVVVPEPNVLQRVNGNNSPFFEIVDDDPSEPSYLQSVDLNSCTINDSDKTSDLHNNYIFNVLSSCREGRLYLSLYKHECDKENLKQGIDWRKRTFFEETLQYIEILNKKFCEGTVCFTRIISDNIQFGKIKKCFNINNVLYLQVEEFETLFFNSLYHAYNVRPRPDKRKLLLLVSKIPRVPPCQLVNKNGELYIATRLFRALETNNAEEKIATILNDTL